MTEKIILFDGVCNLCNGAVQFVIKRDKKNQFRFASLQGEFGQKILREHALEPGRLESFILKEGDRIYTESTGALRVAKELGGFWSWLYAFIIVPRFIRDAVYGWIARNRYTWFGKKEACWVPTAALASRFIT
jgi:predicted DCC family thiol-disulfide oxidoreductase YuxK